MRTQYKLKTELEFEKRLKENFSLLPDTIVEKIDQVFGK